MESIFGGHLFEVFAAQITFLAPVCFVNSALILRFLVVVSKLHCTHDDIFSKFLGLSAGLGFSFDFFHFNFCVAFDGPSTYYIISRGRMGVGGSISKINKIRKKDSYF